MKLPDAKPETWGDLAKFTDWALDTGMDDERINDLCELYLKLQDLFEERDKNRAKH